MTAQKNVEIETSLAGIIGKVMRDHSSTHITGPKRLAKFE
jgi:hypothetical protein